MRHRLGIVVVLAERPDQVAPEDGRRGVAETIGCKVHDRGHEVGAQHRREEERRRGDDLQCGRLCHREAHDEHRAQRDVRRDGDDLDDPMGSVVVAHAVWIRCMSFTGSTNCDVTPQMYVEVGRFRAC
ncbi:MAG: hypothetical protein U0235_16450 [Polyangiaceae bacterium]